MRVAIASQHGTVPAKIMSIPDGLSASEQINLEPLLVDQWTHPGEKEALPLVSDLTVFPLSDPVHVRQRIQVDWRNTT